MKKRKTRTVIAAALITALAAALVILPIGAKKSEATGSSVISAQAEKRIVSQTLVGGGILQSGRAEELSLLEGITVTKYLVANGDYCEKGQPLAEIDPDSLLPMIVGVQESLAIIEKELRSSGDAGRSVVKAPMDARVKAIYAQSGDTAWSVSAEHGSLLLLSLDGMMSVSFDTESRLTPGSTITAVTENGTEYTGKIKSALPGSAIAVLPDDGPALDESVTIKNEDGETIGEGKLCVNSPWKLIVSSGTVDEIYVKTEQTVRRGANLLRIADGNQAETLRLSNLHREYEENLRELMRMLRTGTVTADRDGFVSEINRKLVQTRSAQSAGKLKLLEAEGESALRYSVAWVTAINPDGSFQARTAIWPFEIGDETQLALLSKLAVPMLQEAEETKASFSGAVELDGSSTQEIKPGDLFVLAYDSGELKKVIHIGNEPLATEQELAPDLELGNLDLTALIGNYSGYAPVSPQQEEGLFSLIKTRILNLSPADVLLLPIRVDEHEVLQYQVGMKAAITLDALPEKSFEGTVSGISAVGNSLGGSSKFEITIEIPRAEGMLPGMRAYSSVTLNTEELLALPAAAVFSQGSRSFVYTLYDSQKDLLLNPTPVETGISDGDYIAVSALEEGMNVWYRVYGEGMD